MATEVMDLPRSGYKILRLIIIGFLHQGGSERRPATYDEVSKATSVSPTVVSGNNKALHALGILERSKGRGSYRLTPEGFELARALEFEEAELTRRSLLPLLTENSKIAQMLNALRSRGEWGVDDFVSHIVFVSGGKRDRVSMTGARAILELLTLAGLVEQSDDTVRPIRAEERSVREVDSEASVGEPEGDSDTTALDEEPLSGRDLVTYEPATEERSASTRFAVSVRVTLTGDDLADNDRFADILLRLQELRNLNEPR